MADKFRLHQKVRVRGDNEVGCIVAIEFYEGEPPVYRVKYKEGPPIGSLRAYNLIAVEDAKDETPEPKFSLDETVIVRPSGRLGKVWGIEEVAGTEIHLWKYRVVFNHTGCSAIDYYESELSKVALIADPQTAFKGTPTPKFNAGDLVVYARQFSVTITSAQRVNGDWLYNATTKAGTSFELLSEHNIQHLKPAQRVATATLSDTELGERLRIRMKGAYDPRFWRNVIEHAREVLLNAKAAL